MSNRMRREQALDLINAVYADQNNPYFDADDPRHDRAVEEMTSLFKLAYPSRPAASEAGPALETPAPHLADPSHDSDGASGVPSPMNISKPQWQAQPANAAYPGLTGPVGATASVQGDPVQKTQLADLEVRTPEEEFTENKRREVRENERLLRQHLPKASGRGWSFARENLEYYLDGNGGIKEVPSSRLRGWQDVSDAEALNRWRVELSFQQTAETPGYRNPLFNQIKSLKDGESIEFNNNNAYWDRKVEAPYKSDLFYASNLSVVRSRVGPVRARREGNVIHVSGELFHTWMDKYEWDDKEDKETDIDGFGWVSDKAMKELQTYGNAREYDLRSHWKQGFKGTITLVDGVPVERNFEWVDAPMSQKTVNPEP